MLILPTLLGILAASGPVLEPPSVVAATVNARVVKLFGAGGFRGVTSYGTGLIVSPDGHILTVANQLLDTSKVVLHLADGRRLTAVVVATEPELDLAVLAVRLDGTQPGEPTRLNLPHFDVEASAARAKVSPGDWVLAHANSFEIAMRNEPVTVQRGVIAAVAKLAGRRGVFDFNFPGEVLIVDAITNNPGAAGGALTDRAGNLLGIVGREVKNSLTETWVNYAIPVTAQAEIRDGDTTRTISMSEFVKQARAGTYKVMRRPPNGTGPAGYHGIVFVPNILARTPPYVEDVLPGSPAEAAGLMPNDLIAFIDGEPAVSVSSFQTQVARQRPGSVLRLEIRRGDTLQTVELKLADPPSP